MGASGSFPIDLILFGMIAAFLVLRLRSVLGRRTGFERPAQPQQVAPAPSQQQQGPVIDGKAEPAPPAQSHTIPDPNSPLGQSLARFRQTDPTFEPGAFLAGAEKAFRMIVAAFASGDRQTLRTLLSAETYAAFDAAITAREQQGQTQVSEIRSIQSLAIEGCDLRGSMGLITVRISSDQVSFTRDANGQLSVGTDAVTEITDLWTFEREMRTSDPTWRLTEARSA